MASSVTALPTRTNVSRSWTSNDTCHLANCWGGGTAVYRRSTAGQPRPPPRENAPLRHRADRLLDALWRGVVGQSRYQRPAYEAIADPLRVVADDDGLVDPSGA